MTIFRNEANISSPIVLPMTEISLKNLKNKISWHEAGNSKQQPTVFSKNNNLSSFLISSQKVKMKRNARGEFEL